MPSMARDFHNMEKKYKDNYKYNKKLVDLVKYLCPFQKGTRVELIQHIKYFPEVPIGSPGTITGIDYNSEYKYIVSVLFDHIPKRYFWMPCYLFRTSEWVEKSDKRIVRKSGKITMTIEPQSNESFVMTISDDKKTIAKFSAESKEEAIKVAELFYNSYRIMKL